MWVCAALGAGTPKRKEHEEEEPDGTNAPRLWSLEQRRCSIGVSKRDMVTVRRPGDRREKKEDNGTDNLRGEVPNLISSPGTVTALRERRGNAR